MDLGLDLEGTVVILTGAAGQIGQLIVEGSFSAGCYVGAFDIDPTKFSKEHESLMWVQVDMCDEQAMDDAWKRATIHFSSIPTVCVCAAAIDSSFLEHHQSIVNMPVKQFRRN